MFTLVGGRYQSLELLEQRFWIEQLGLGLGIWQGAYRGIEGKWLRWYDRSQNWISTDLEARQLAEQQAQTEAEARQLAEQQVRSAVPRLASIGLTAEQIAEALGLSIAEVEQQLQTGLD